MTMIEVLVSLLLVSIAVVGMIDALGKSLPNATDAENRNKAALIANQIASQMWINQGVTSCTGTTPTDTFCNGLMSNIASTTLANGNPNPNYLPGGSINITSPSAAVAQIQIVWTTPGTKWGATTAPQQQYTTQVMLP